MHQAIKIGEMIAFFEISTRQHVSPSKCSLLFGPQGSDAWNHDAIKSVLQVESEVFEENYLGLSFPDGG